MIDIVIYKKDGVTVGFKAQGHAYFDEPGYDVVCAAISVLSINTENSIDIMTDDPYTVEMDEDGFLHLMMTDSISHDTSVLMTAFEIGVTAVSKEYGKDYIQIRIEEV